MKVSIHLNPEDEYHITYHVDGSVTIEFESKDFNFPSTASSFTTATCIESKDAAEGSDSKIDASIPIKTTEAYENKYVKPSAEFYKCSRFKPITDACKLITSNCDMLSFNNKAVGEDQETEIDKFGRIKYGFPSCTDKAFGREKELEYIRDKLKIRVPVAIIGMAASGKTTLATEYALRWVAYGDNTSIRDIALMDATSEKSFSDSVRGLIALLNITIKTFKTRHVLHKIFSYYAKKNRELLLIYDNVEKFIEIENYVFHEVENVHLLVTTQNKGIGNIFSCVFLGNLSKEGIRVLLEKKLPTEIFLKINEKNLYRLTDVLDELPFVPILAAVYITQELYFESDVNVIINDYIENFKKYLETEKPSEVRKEYEKLYVALRLNIEKLCTETIHTLCTISYMETAHIHMDTITKFHQHLSKFGLYPNEINPSMKDNTKRKILTALKDLEKYSLVKVDENRQKIYIQKLITTICRNLFRDNIVKYIATLMLSLQEDKNRFEHYINFFHICELDTLVQAFQLFVKDEQNKTFVEYINKKLLKFNLDAPMSENWHLFSHLLCSARSRNKKLDVFQMKESSVVKLIEVLETKDKEIYKIVQGSWNTLHFACLVSSGVQNTIENYPDLKELINKQTEIGLSALHISAVCDNIENVKYLVNNGCDINMKNISGSTAAHLAARFAYLYTTCYLYFCEEFDRCVKNNANNTVLEYYGSGYSYTDDYTLSDGETVQVTYTWSACARAVRSLSGDIIYRHIASWPCVIKPDDLVEIMAKELKYFAWWDRNETRAARELVILLGNVYDTWPSPLAYMRANNIRVSQLIQILRKEKPHEVLSTYSFRSGNSNLGYYYKLICVCIDKVEELNPATFRILRYVSYSPKQCISKHHLLQLLDFDDKKMESCLSILNQYELIKEEDKKKVIGLQKVTAIVHVYVELRKLTKDTIKALLLNPNSSDEEINDYLKNTDFYW